MLLITSSVYNLFSPFEVAERFQMGKAYHGDDTAFGRFGEEKLLPLFGVTACPEKGNDPAWDPRASRDRWFPIESHGLESRPSLKDSASPSDEAICRAVFQDIRDFTARVLVVASGPMPLLSFPEPIQA